MPAGDAPGKVYKQEIGTDETVNRFRPDVVTSLDGARSRLGRILEHLLQTTAEDLCDLEGHLQRR